MAQDDIKWGIVSTIKAPVEEILRFVAYHLDLGAAQITICLDDDNPHAKSVLDAHPKCRAIRTDRAYWKETCGYVPKKHQVRQALSASRIYNETQDLDWLAHIDVDEFITPKTTLQNELSQVPESVGKAHLTPCESLCVEDFTNLDPVATYCKARPKPGQGGRDLEAELYPNFGGYFKDGFISHTAGKNLVRVGRAKVHFGIHRAFDVVGDGERVEIPAGDTPAIELCHRHVESWEKWLDIMEFRMSKGSYRAELDEKIDPLTARVGRHTLFSSLQEDGITELRAFFEEVCLASPGLLERLKAHDLLRTHRLELSQKVQKHFPEFRL